MIRLALRALRHPADRWARLEAALPVLAVAVCTLLVLLTLGARHGFAARADRAAWRQLVPSGSAGTGPGALVATRTESVRGRSLVVVDWADLGTGALRPPGLDRPPAPGQVAVSPALADLLAELPGDELAGRFPAAPSARLGPDALVHDDELVAVIGRAPTDPAVTAPRPTNLLDPSRAQGPTAIDHLGTAWDLQARLWVQLASLATVLLVLPLLTLGASAARLVAARRRQQLALVRLVGATTAQAARLAAAEAFVLAALGALAGVVLYLPALLAARHVTVAGGSWPAGDLWIGPAAVAATVAGVTALVGLSALVALRPAVRQPLAGVRVATPDHARLWRLLAALTVGGLALTRAEGGWRLAAVPLAGLILALQMVGPWAVKLLGLAMTRTSRRAPRLLAGRRLLEDPRSGWRAVSGAVLASFVAGFLAFLVPGALADTGGGALRVRVPFEQADALAAQARQRLDAAGLALPVRLTDAYGPEQGRPPSPGGEAAVAVDLPHGADEARTADRVRTALAGLVPGVGATTWDEESPSIVAMIPDLRLGAGVVLITSFLIAGVGAAVGGIGRVLDQRRSLTLLRLAGTPVSVLAAARRREVTAPLLVFAGGAAALGSSFAVAMQAGASMAPDGRGAQLAAALLGLGAALILAGDAVSRPVLRAATADLAQRE